MPPRTDGLYVYRDRERASIIRFFANGTVVAVETEPRESLDEMLRWLVPTPDTIRAAAYTLEGDTLAFVDQWGEAANEATEYRGTWAEDHLQLDEVSRRNEYRATRRYELQTTADIAADERAKRAKRTDASARAKARK